MQSLQERVQVVLKEEVAIMPYDARWPERFRQEEQHLRTVLPHELVGGIEHYGSTAVAGLPAKPIIVRPLKSGACYSTVPDIAGLSRGLKCRHLPVKRK